jgi:hypothetical protein
VFRRPFGPPPDGKIQRDDGIARNRTIALTQNLDVVDHCGRA